VKSNNGGTVGADEVEVASAVEVVAVTVVDGLVDATTLTGTGASLVTPASSSRPQAAIATPAHAVMTTRAIEERTVMPPCCHPSSHDAAGGENTVERHLIAIDRYRTLLHR
jgi:hypothetical protein